MANKPSYAAYVVYKGRVPGVYNNWAACQEQIDDFQNHKCHGYARLIDAEVAWKEWLKKISLKLEAKLKPDKTARVWMGSIHQPVVVDQQSHPIQHHQQPSGLKRPSAVVDLTNDSDDGWPPAKRSKPEPVDFREAHAQFEQQQTKAAVVENIELSEEQEKVLKMALRGDNIFLTGAAGSGKTVTLKAILTALRKKKKKNNRKHNLQVHVVAPTGIAALPLDGKTTYSFAGWSPDSMRLPINELLSKRKQRVVQTIQNMDVLVVEEISMVENQFLERLNLLLQDAMSQPWLDPSTAPSPEVMAGQPPNTLPFGGKQVILLGDFHQLPPVLPFEYCLQCGEPIPKKPIPKPSSQATNLPWEFACISDLCKSQDGVRYKEGDKWAFKAPVWKQLNLRHVKLEQIHRQKDTGFQDILNKIRNGELLSEQEWRDLERPKGPPKGAFTVRLMSRLNQVDGFNRRQLDALRGSLKRWTALDDCKKLVGEATSIQERWKLKEYTDSLKEHRFQKELALKIGTRVVLLYNLDHKRGLVNGSQGVVVGFSPATPVSEEEVTGEQKPWRMGLLEQFQSGTEDNSWRPLVRFSNGVTVSIPAVASASIRGGGQKHEQYLACRTQIPLTLAWALSIHKSQGMTLEYVEVSSKDLFESGQLYVALSRATHLEGLNLTGFSREQLPMDKDVLEFYTTTKWENLQPRKKRESRKGS